MDSENKEGACFMFGKKGKDIITGFEGIITGKVDYITGCSQYLIAPISVNNDAKENRWIDVDRVEILPDEQIVLKKTFQGSDTSAPIK